MKKQLCIKNGIIISMNENHDIYKADLLIENGIIQKIAPKIMDLRSEEVDASNCVILPSFYNVHIHLGETIFRGKCDGMNLWEYLNISHEAYHNKKWMENESGIHQLSGLITIGECIRNGVGYICCNRGWDEVKQTAIKANCLYPVVNISKLKSYYNEILQIHQMKEEYESDRIHTSIFLQSLYLCESAQLVQIDNVMRADPSINLFVHLSETVEEIEYVKKHFNMSPVEVLYQYHLLNSRTYCVHAIYLNGEDIDLLKRTGAKVVLCPVSNLKLGDGFPDIVRFQQAQIPTIIATDGFATNNSANLLEELKVMELMNSGKLSCNFLLDSITRTPAYALTQDRKAGTIQEGANADISVFSSDIYNLYNYKDIPNHLIYHFNDFICEHVICQGEFLLKSRRFITLDYEKVSEQYYKMMEELFNQAINE